MSEAKEKTIKPIAEAKSPKAKKMMYEQLFNEIFGTNIKWGRLSLEELTQLATVLANPEPLIKRLGGLPTEEAAATTLVGLVKRVLEGREGPLMRLAKRFLKREGEA
jgi:hypothetical protein